MEGRGGEGGEKEEEEEGEVEHLPVIGMENIPYNEITGGNPRISCFRGDLRKFSLRKSIFKRGAPDYRKCVKVISLKIYFQAIQKSFLPLKKPAIRDCIVPYYECTIHTHGSVLHTLQ